MYIIGRLSAIQCCLFRGAPLYMNITVILYSGIMWSGESIAISQLCAYLSIFPSDVSQTDWKVNFNALSESFPFCDLSRICGYQALLCMAVYPRHHFTHVTSHTAWYSYMVTYNHNFIVCTANTTHNHIFVLINTWLILKMHQCLD